MGRQITQDAPTCVRRTRPYERSAISDLRSLVSSYRSIVTRRAIDNEDSKPRAISRRLRVHSLYVYRSMMPRHGLEAYDGSEVDRFKAAHTSWGTLDSIGKVRGNHGVRE